MRWIVLLLLFSFASGYSQNLVPAVQQFTTFDHGAGHQNWGIDQSDEGYIYAANQKGLLQFNGSTWRLFPLPEGTIVRSVKCIGNRVYVGSYNEFGYFFTNDKGQFAYHSISKLETDYEFIDEEFWQIIEVENQIAFRSFRDVYLVTNEEEITPLQLSALPNQMAYHNGHFYIILTHSGLFDYTTNQASQIDAPEELIQDRRVVIAEYLDNQLLFCNSNFDCYTFRENKFEPLQIPNHPFFKDNLLNDVKVIDDGTIVFGSIQKGLFSWNPNSEEDDYNLQKKDGLLNNTILNVLIDLDQNVWLALDDGISLIHQSSPNRYYTDRIGELGAVYAITEFEQKLYLGTNKGVFYFSENELKQVENIRGQVWYLDVIDGQLICGQNNGTYRIQNKVAEQISSFSGVWNIKPNVAGVDNYLQCTYNGFVEMRMPNQWEFKRFFGLLSPIRDFEIQNETDIVGIHAYEGVFLFRKIKDSIQTIKKLSQSIQQNEVDFDILKLNKHIYVRTSQDWRHFDPLLDSLVIDHSIQKLVDLSHHPKLIHSSRANEIWLRNKDLITRYDVNEKKKMQQSFFRLEPRTIGKYESVYQNEDKFYLNLNNGFVRSSFSNNTILPKTIRINRIYNKQDSIYNFSKTPLFRSNANSIHFDFFIPEFANQIEYQYRLSSNQDWKTSFENHLFIENVSPGKHHFEVRALYPNGEATNTAKASFRIQQPIWFRWYSIVIGLLLILLAMYLIRLTQRRKYIKKRKAAEEQLKIEHDLQLQREHIINQKNIAELKNKQLGRDIEYRQKELANTTLSLVQKNEILNKIKSELLIANQESPNIHIDNTIKMINRSLSQNENWKLFESRFNEIHDEFLQQLKQQYPDLTRKDLKLCAFIKTNLSSKEIAPLMNITVRGVETHRYRLRKKLNIDNNENLLIFLENL